MSEYGYDRVAAENGFEYQARRMSKEEIEQHALNVPPWGFNVRREDREGGPRVWVFYFTAKTGRGVSIEHPYLVHAFLSYRKARRIF